MSNLSKSQFSQMIGKIVYTLANKYGILPSKELTQDVVRTVLNIEREATYVPKIEHCICGRFFVDPDIKLCLGCGRHLDRVSRYDEQHE